MTRLTRDSSKDTIGQVDINTTTYNTFIAAGYDTIGTKDKVYLRDWTGDFYSLTINTYPSDSTVTLSYADTEYDSKTYTQKTLTNIPGGKTINYTVSHYDYVTKTGSITITSNEVKLVSLETGTYPSGMVIFESSTPGTYDLDIEFSQNYSIELVGGGGGGAHTHYWIFDAYYNGGSGAKCSGTTNLSSGIYTVVVGQGGESKYWESTASVYGITGDPGTSSTFLNNIAGGGNGGSAYATYAGGGWGSHGGGGTAQPITGFTGQNGSAGDTTGIDGHGAGGQNVVTNGGNGYVKIVAL